MGREERANRESRAKDMVIVASAYGGSVTVPYYLSMMALQQVELAKPRGVRRLAEAWGNSGLYVALNRNRLANRFYEHPEREQIPWLLWIDSDIQFPPSLIEAAVVAANTVGAKVMAINVPLGSHPSVAYYATEGAGIYRPATIPLPKEQVFECDAVATAVCLVHRDVIDAIAEMNGRCWFHHLYVPYPPEGETIDRCARRDIRYHEIGEDLAFCARAKTAGFKVWCCHGIPGIIHHKTRPLSETRGIVESAVEAIGAERVPDFLRWASGQVPEDETGEIVDEATLTDQHFGYQGV